MRVQLPFGQPVGELVCACFFLALGAFVLIDGLQYPVMVDGVVGPGLMPMIWGLGLTIPSVVLVLNALKNAPAADILVAPPDESQDLSIADFAEDDGGGAGKPVTVAGILVMMGLAVALAPLFGLIPMLGLLVFVCVFVFEREGFVTAALMSIGSMIASWALFVWLFEVPVPSGSVWQILGL